MAPVSLKIRTNSEQTWLFLFLPALLYYIYSCNNPNDRYTIIAPPNNNNGATTTPGGSSGIGILSSLQLSQSYRVVASSVKLAGASAGREDATLAEVAGPYVRLAPVDNDDDHRDWPLTYPLEAVIGLQPRPLLHRTPPPSVSPPNIGGGPVRNHHFTSSVWVHDEELGRGYLLVSDSLHSGTVWRWEVGGGPITIGRSLYLKDSGCRSRIWADCPLSGGGTGSGRIDRHDVGHGDGGAEGNVPPERGEPATVRLGSGGITIQSPKDSNHFQSGSLIVVEKGERRIVRMEVDGARTPLVLQVPPLVRSDDNDDGGAEDEEEGGGTTTKTTRLNDPGLILYTPFGDLIFTDRRTITTSGGRSDDSCGSTGGGRTSIAGIYRMNEVVNVPPLSFRSSRGAHAWTHVEEETASTTTTAGAAMIEILYNDGLESITGLTLGKDLNTVFIAGRKAIVTDGGGGGECSRLTRQYIIVKSSLDDDEEDDEEDDGNEEDPIISTNRSHEGDGGGSEQQRQQQKKIDERVPGLLDTKSTLFYDMTHFFSDGTGDGDDNDVGPAVAVDKSGTVYATFPGGVAIIDPDGELLATVPFFAAASTGTTTPPTVIVPNSITFGHDGYLYVTSRDALMRMRVKSLPVETPTNLIVPPKKKVHTYTS